MKKLILSAFVAFAATANVQAAGPVTDQSSPATVNFTDILTMVPNGTRNGTLNFNTLQDYVDGVGWNTTYTVTANRNWTTKADMGDFILQTTGTGAAATVSPNGIVTLTTSNLGSDVTSSAGTFNINNTPKTIVKGTGTMGTTFKVDWLIKPGLNKNMGGEYHVDAHIITSLD